MELENYKLGPLIGKGCHGQIFQVTNLDDINSHLVCKV
jgi:hypothetical protein